MHLEPRRSGRKEGATETVRNRISFEPVEMGLCKGEIRSWIGSRSHQADPVESGDTALATARRGLDCVGGRENLELADQIERGTNLQWWENATFNGM